MSKYKPIIVLGGGKMGGALAVRWQASHLAHVHVVERDADRRAELALQGIIGHATLADAPTGSAVLVLAIKPQQFAGMVEEIKTHLAPETMPLSIMAGIPIAALQQLAPHAVRVMPNLPALIGEGMTVGYSPHPHPEDRAMIADLFNAVGKFAWVEDEALLHAATAISGSGPAYVFAFMEALQAAAIAEGLPEEIARHLVGQTFRGAVLLADQSVENTTVLRCNVTSPGGTTEAALQVFAAGKLDDLVRAAAHAAVQRSKALST
jgi:pyrroline-5-carboxylate reductase